MFRVHALIILAGFLMASVGLNGCSSLTGAVKQTLELKSDQTLTAALARSQGEWRASISQAESHHYSRVVIEKQFWENHSLQPKLQEIVEKLVAVSHNTELPVKIHVVKDRATNAFNTGGGYIYITSGLLEQAGSEDELAFILGHELAHATANHVSRQILPNLILNLGALLAQSISESNTADEIIARVNQYLTMGYSRRYEREADVLGTVYALKAGYKPLKGADFFIKGAKKEEQLLKEAEKTFRGAEDSYKIVYAQYQSNSGSLIELLTGYYSRRAKSAYDSYLQARERYLTVVNDLSPLFRSHPMNEERIATLHEVVNYLEGKQVRFSTSEAVYTLNVLSSLDRRILQKQHSEGKGKVNE